jgi:hypothetical protein
MKSSIHQSYEDLNTKLNEWYGCMPYGALSKIHQEDVLSLMSNRTDEEIEEIITDLRFEWFAMSTDEKIEAYEFLNEEYKMFVPQSPKKVNILNLYADDFRRDTYWEDICEVVGADASSDNISIQFTEVDSNYGSRF